MKQTKRSDVLNRRRFVAAGVSIAAVGCGANQSPWRVLTEAEGRTLTAICDQIVPPDQDPGGAWAGVATYIDRQLARTFREHLQTYRAGLAEADLRAGGSFPGLARGQQIDLLQKMEKGKATRAFMSLVISHAIQGFYGSPRHGGNRDYCSWRMLGVPASPVRGRDPYDFTNPYDLTKGGPA